MTIQPVPIAPARVLTLRWQMLLILVGILILAPPSVFAQTAEGEAAQAAEEAEAAAPDAAVPKAMEEIVVTARKRAENVQDVPIAISVIRGAELADVTATDISELERYVPNLSIYQGRNQSTTLTAFVRGVGQADPLWGFDPGVGLYINDVYVARMQGALLDVFDTERVEVLRGPQGTLYGKNTVGGAIKYVGRPVTDELEARIALTGGTFGTQEVRANVGGPLIKGKLRGKISFANLQRDGYGTNLYNGKEVSNKDTTAYRLALDWLPSDSVMVQFSYDGSQDRAEPIGLTRLEANQWCPFFLGTTCEPLPDLFDTESGQEDQFNATDVNGYALTVTWDINSDWTFKSITAYRETDTDNGIDFDTTPARIADVWANYYDDQTTQEFQLIFDSGGRWNGVMGFYYFDGKAGGQVRSIFFDAPSAFAFPLVTEGLMRTDSYALFGQANYNISDRLVLNFGLRPTRETKHGVAYNTACFDDEFTTCPVVVGDFDDTVTFTSLAPKIGLDYSLSNNALGYFTLSRGFKSGGYNVGVQNAVPSSKLPFDDEVLTMAEVGVKSTLANQSLILNAAVFYGDYDDVQVSSFTSYDSDGDGEDDAFFRLTGNGGNATLKGLEVEYNWMATSVFGLSGNVSYLDAKPDEFLDLNENGFVDTQVITNAPEWTASLRANLNFPAFGGTISGSVGLAYRDDSVLTNEGDADPRDPTGQTELLPIVQPSFTTLDAWIGWLSANGRWRFNITGKNLTDEEYLLTGYNIPVLGIFQGSYGAPRRVYGTVEFNF